MDPDHAEDAEGAQPVEGGEEPDFAEFLVCRQADFASVSDDLEDVIAESSSTAPAKSRPGHRGAGKSQVSAVQLLSFSLVLLTAGLRPSALKLRLEEGRIRVKGLVGVFRIVRIRIRLPRGDWIRSSHVSQVGNRW